MNGIEDANYYKLPDEGIYRGKWNDNKRSGYGEY